MPTKEMRGLASKRRSFLKNPQKKKNRKTKGTRMTTHGENVRRGAAYGAHEWSRSPFALWPKGPPERCSIFQTKSQATTTSVAHELEIVHRIVKLAHLSFHCRPFCPRNMIFHLPRHMNSRICHEIGPNPDMSMFDER